jgi:hypothetical protein
MTKLSKGLFLMLAVPLAVGFSLWLKYWHEESRHDTLITALCQLINVADAIKQHPDKLDLIKKANWQSEIYPIINHDECSERLTLLNGKMVDVLGNSYVVSKENGKLIVASDLKVVNDDILRKKFIVKLDF